MDLVLRGSEDPGVLELVEPEQLARATAIEIDAAEIDGLHRLLAARTCELLGGGPTDRADRPRSAAGHRRWCITCELVDQGCGRHRETEARETTPDLVVGIASKLAATPRTSPRVDHVCCPVCPLTTTASLEGIRPTM